ncbi:MAG: preprotein translocase subunit SecE [Chitinophagales bacterium]|nr:preprotein translocase subunit SecE [Chitinophagales bacterium]
MNKISTFFSDIYTELILKVSWPSWEDLQNSLIVVTTSALILAGIVWVMNFFSNLALTTFYHLFQ